MIQPPEAPRPPRAKQIFFTQSRRRWRLLKGAGLIILFVVALITAVIAVAIAKNSAISLPKLAVEPQHFKGNFDEKEVTGSEKPTSEKSFQAAKSQLEQELIRSAPPSPTSNHRGAEEAVRLALPIRAGFYVTWDAQSFFSLRNNISSLNVVFPEWFLLKDEGNDVESLIDDRALKLMREHNVAIIPMLSNFYNQVWNGKNVHRVIANKSNRTELIQNLIKRLDDNHFAGLNIDFEELQENSDEHLTEFIKELSVALHSRGYLLTQDIAPGNSDYDLKKLSAYNDYLVVMAYDQHYQTSAPGPVSDLRWVAKALGAITNQVDPQKLIIGAPTYGYDWPKTGDAADVTYQEAVITAKESEAEIQFDKQSSNLTFQYEDDNDQPHTVWFTDAGTTFNLLRLIDGTRIAGVALWRLGGEDVRLWEFFHRELSESALKQSPFDPKTLAVSHPSSDIDYDGEGEILDVIATPAEGKIDVAYNAQTNTIEGQKYLSFPSTYIVKKFGKQDKTVALTFDDGPDEDWTPAILDILKAEKVPATFFVVGVAAEKNLSTLKRIYAEGHEIGNHTFTHPNMAEVSENRSLLELTATRRLIEGITGHSTILFRPPYNADSEPETAAEIIPVAIAKRENYYTIGESVDTRDWEPGVTVGQIMKRVHDEELNGSIVLLHDAGGDRSATIAALPKIIAYYRNHGYTFTTIAQMIGKTREQVMPPLAYGSDKVLAGINGISAEAFFWGMKIVSSLFVLSIVLSILRTIIIAILSAIQKQKITKRDRLHPPVISPATPMVSVIIPAFNEVVTVTQTIQTILASEYPNFEIILVDDGSTDGTFERVDAAYHDQPHVKRYQKVNEGKASALNFGIEHALGEILVCIDADTQLDSQAIAQLVKEMQVSNAAAVAGNVKVGNEKNLLTLWQSVEYITSQNFDRRAFSLLNCITVIPGAIGAFRRDALKSVRGFLTDTLAEDCDVTIRLLKKGYRVCYASNAIAYTEAPESWSMFFKQRFRWSYGILQNIWKHRDVFFDIKAGTLGWIALPQALIFQFLMPMISPLADLVLIVSIVGGFWRETIGYYLLFVLIDISAAMVAFSYEGESYIKTLAIVPQRFIYRQVMYLVLIKAILSALAGRLIEWGKLHRTGSVKHA